MVSGDSVAAQLGNGVEFESSKSQGLFHDNHPFSGTPALPLTVECLVFADTAETVNGIGPMVVQKGVDSNYYFIQSRNGSTGISRLTARNTTARNSDGSTDLRNAWHQMVGRFVADQERRLLIDGVEEANDTTNSVSMNTFVDRISVGYLSRLTPGGYSNDKYDEVRWSEIDRTTGWYLAQWNNHSDSTSFYTDATPLAKP